MLTRQALSISLITLLAFAMTANAQVITGTISGTVKDGTGAILPATTLVVLNEDTGISRSAQTDAMGRYVAAMLPLGSYRVTVSLVGFQTGTRRGIELTVGRQAVVDFELTVGAISQTVEVTGEAPLIETRESAVSYLVSEATISDLPLNGRDITQLILLQPGVSLAENSATGNAYVGFGKKFSIGGMRGEDNAYLLDGGYINNMNRQLPSGPSGALLGSETVKEFQVLTNSYGAQFGRALGGVFNAVSKSGSNEWHGNMFEYFRDNDLDARKFFDRQVQATDPRNPEFRRNSFGGSAGGPIERDHSFFFASYEAMREAKSETSYRVVPDENARRGNIQGVAPFTVSPRVIPFLNLFPMPSAQGARFPTDGTAQYIFIGGTPAQDDYGQGRIDYQLSDNMSWFGRFTGSNAHKTFPESYPGYETTQVMNTRLLTISETQILSPSMLNTVRVHFNRIDPQDVGKYPVGDPSVVSNPSTTIPASINPGSGVTANAGAPKPFDRWVTNRYNFQEEMSWTLGGHGLQYGGMMERLQFNMVTPNRPFGEWTWSLLQDFLQGNNPASYRGTPESFGNTNRGFRQWFMALYIQDDWKFSNRVTLNLGVRWEPYTVPTEVNGKVANLRHLLDTSETIGNPYWKNQSWTDFAPRIGFAWSPLGPGTSVRGGAGLFYVPNDPSTYRSAANRNMLFPEFQFSSPQGFPNALAAIAAAPAAEAPEAIPYENHRSPHALQYNLNIQQQIGANSVISIGYAGARGLNATCFCQYNSPALVYNGRSLEVPVGATRPNLRYQDIKYYANAADSWYNGMMVSLQRRFSSGLQTQASYTFSKALSTADSNSKTDSSGGGGGSPKYASDLRTAKGYSGYHIAHVLSANYVYDIPGGQGLHGTAGHLSSGWQISGIVSLKTGQPFNVNAAVPTALSALGLTRSPILNSAFPKEQIILGGPDKALKYFDTTAFLAPRQPVNNTNNATGGEIGNVVKNFLIGPGTATWDFSLTKNATLTESWRMQFRAEFFNILNRANFAKPAASIFNASGVLSGSAGNISNTTTEGRQIQFGLRLNF
ncbi:MAG: hypothetical protein EXQ56_13655 [Acidobacteria bacterium]|nr:hypothetical protein [Acidobacteriota bacterium]